MGAYGEALAVFDVAARLRPDDPTTHYCRGMTHYVMGENSRAIRDFTEVIQLNSEHANAYRYLGDAFARMGKYSLAGADRATFERLSRPTGKGILR